MTINKIKHILRYSKVQKILILFFIVRISFLSISCSNVKTEKPTSVNSSKALISNISVIESYNLINSNNDNADFVILDIRTPGEFSMGYIKNAINIDFYNSNFLNKLNELDKSKKYLIYCRSANRSGKAILIMQDLGFSEVYNMLGGITSWESNNYPIVK